MVFDETDKIHLSHDTLRPFKTLLKVTCHSKSLFQNLDNINKEKDKRAYKDINRKKGTQNYGCDKDCWLMLAPENRWNLCM